ncbi:MULTISPECIES: hypothetical protein [Pseudomonas]|uniref:hypothetical protein n=1 Tax=Pseudomonas TaxID=286 RepID=UPI000B34EF5E|nr:MULTISPECIES: hypothetical protein [Pseudomonas]PMY49130.1 hypothetical protein C1X70_23360 [Pseudomonas sp. FW305-53]PMY85665.1 hypothetical protein C1X68_17860 [Pseudomonas sp. FW303-C2]PMY92871.1 hypothetical protein C1X67_10710 [Pseudomonas sp. FW305-62]PNA44384.1 hypothetical protein C1X71_08205 [Pseudomonas sp. FW306-2-2C-A10BC]PNA83045.1 hypothetical protein C1X66_25845 [Pseudomonas sp. MPR-R3B]
MSKFQIVVEDSSEGVSISVDNQAQIHHSKAGRVATAMVQTARLVARLPLETSERHLGGCDCDICMAMREKLILNPTLH